MIFVVVQMTKSMHTLYHFVFGTFSNPKGECVVMWILKGKCIDLYHLHQPLDIWVTTRKSNFVFLTLKVSAKWCENNMICVCSDICDVIKLNQSSVGNIDFEIKPIIALKFIVLSSDHNTFRYYGLRFWATLKWSYLWNDRSDWDGVCAKIKLWKWVN